MFAGTPWRVHAGWKMLKTKRDIICVATEFAFNLVVLASSSEDADIHVAIRWRSVRFRGSVVARLNVSVSMFSFVLFCPQTA